MSVGPRKTELRTWAGRKRVEPPPDQAHHKSKKDTKRWCRGKIGVEHVYSWVIDKMSRSFPSQPKWYERLCENCGKKNGWCSGWPSYMKNGKKHGGCICGHHVEPTPEPPEEKKR